MLAFPGFEKQSTKTNIPFVDSGKYLRRPQAGNMKRPNFRVVCVSNTKPNTSIGQGRPISASDDQRPDLEALQACAARATGTPVAWWGCIVGEHL